MEFDPILVHKWLERSARLQPEKDALVCEKDRWTYGRLDACSNRLAGFLLDSGLCRQDRVVILTGNSPEMVVSLYGTLKAGGIFVILNGNSKPRRLRFVLEDSGARVLIARVDQTPVVKEAMDGLDHEVRVVWFAGGEPSRECRGVSSSIEGTVFSETPENDFGGVALSDGDSDAVDLDLAAIIYTSGTTGEPKGVMCTHHNMISAAKSIIGYLGNREDDVLLSALPLSFSYGLYQVLTSCMFGGTVVLERSFLYPHVVLSRIEEESVTGFPLVPSMAAMILAMESVNKYDLHTLRYITSAGAALPVGCLQRLRRLAPQAEIFNMYGLTECVRVSYLRGAELDLHPTSVGRPMPNCDVRIVDEGGDEVAEEEVGELVVRGSNVAQGYWGDLESTARVWPVVGSPPSRWLRTGDCFRRDSQGLLYFLGRKDDMIKTRGERVSPQEVESALSELEEVVEVAVVGVPDDLWGQAIKAFVVSRTASLDERSVLRHCVNRLESYMIPRFIQVVAELPRTPHGKIDRRQLRDMQVIDGDADANGHEQGDAEDRRRLRIEAH